MIRSSFLMILFPILLISCNKKHDSVQSKMIKKYYLAHKHRSDRTDTIKYEDLNKNIGLLNVMDSISFDFQRRYIMIKKLSNLPNAPSDGKFMAYWEKSVGVFYTRSLSWYNFSILQTDNDSINKYIMGLLGNLLLYEKMYADPGVIKSKIKFESPTLME